MAKSFEELDYRHCALGELVLRRRRPVSMPDTWVYEVKLDGHFLMSSLVHVSEEELARLALARVDRARGDHARGDHARAGATRQDQPGTRVLVGGLGLGHTAAAALAWPGVAAVEVLEFLPEIIAWHEKRLVPLAATLGEDERCRIVQGDCFARIRNGAAGEFDAVLIDIDDGPEELLNPDHRSFYSVDGLRSARRCLRAGGVFALWTSRPRNEAFHQRLRVAFGAADAEEVHFHNPLLSADEVNTVYLASR